MSVNFEEIKKRAQVREGIGESDGKFFLPAKALGFENPMIGTVMEVGVRHPALVNKGEQENERKYLGLQYVGFADPKRVYDNVKNDTASTTPNPSKGQKNIKYYVEAEMIFFPDHTPNTLEVYPGQQLMFEAVGTGTSKKGKSYLKFEVRDLTADGMTQELGLRDFLAGTPGE